MYILGICRTQVHHKFIHSVFHDDFVFTEFSCDFCGDTFTDGTFTDGTFTGGAFTGIAFTGDDFTGDDFADISGDVYIVGFTFCLDTLTTIFLVCFMLPSPIICP